MYYLSKFTAKSFSKFKLLGGFVSGGQYTLNESFHAENIVELRHINQ